MVCGSLLRDGSYRLTLVFPALCSSLFWEQLLFLKEHVCRGFSQFWILGVAFVGWDIS